MASSASGLALAVNKLAADGWTYVEEVHRGQDRRIRRHYSELMQAMVREESQ